ncbi:MAG TPA: hypothetical protein VIK89_05515 [Cytophagaceae bacterium]
MIHYSKKGKIYFPFLLLFLFLSCQSHRSNNSTDTTFNQGLKGKIIFKEGNFYPNGEIRDRGSIYAVERQIYVHELTTISEVDLAEGNFLKNVYSAPIDTVYSDHKGEFKIPLEPGKYSLFINENQRLYSKMTEGGKFFPVEVVKDSVKEITIEIDYKAIY